MRQQRGFSLDKVVAIEQLTIGYANYNRKRENVQRPRYLQAIIIINEKKKKMYVGKTFFVLACKQKEQKRKERKGGGEERT